MHAASHSVCVPEPGHSQVQAILDACVAQGLTRELPAADLSADPLGAILDQWDRVDENQNIVRNMSKIQTGREETIAESITDRLG